MGQAQIHAHRDLDAAWEEEAAEVAGHQNNWGDGVETVAGQSHRAVPAPILKLAAQFSDHALAQKVHMPNSSFPVGRGTQIDL